jgi:hypothetical protein
MSIKEEFANLSTEVSDLRSFGIVVGLAFGVLWFLLRGLLVNTWLGGDHPVLAGIAAVLVVLGAVLPKVLLPVYKVWMAFALVMGFFMTNLLLTIFFFLVLTPVGLFFRLIGRDELKRKIDRGAETYWEPKEYPIADRSRYENFF